MVRERELIMLNEIPRRTFFSALSALALSPLAWLGLRKKQDKSQIDFANDKFAADLFRQGMSYWEKRALAAEKALKEAQAEEDVFSYKSVPLEKVGTIQVRYKDAQSLKPLLWQ